MVEYRQNINGLKQSVIFRKPLSVGQAAKICRVSKKTVLNWIYRDALKAFTTLGGHYRIWPADLQKFILSSGMDIQFQYVDERKTTFLIVDDDPAYTFLLKEAISVEFPDGDIIITDDGYEALLLIGERKPQIVILDLKMPKVNGFQVLELLKKHKKDDTMKVIVLSAYIDSQVRLRLRDTIADHVLEKGKDVKQIIQAIKTLIESSHSLKFKNNQPKVAV